MDARRAPAGSRSWRRSRISELRAAGLGRDGGFKSSERAPADRPEGCCTRFVVERGFSGGPVLDDIGNVVWGMIASVDAAGRGVAHAIPAEELWEGVRSAGVGANARLSGHIAARLERAMAAVRE